jgi:hypothetical protein
MLFIKARLSAGAERLPLGKARPPHSGWRSVIF